MRTVSSRFKSTVCAVTAGIIIALTGAQAVEACSTFRTIDVNPVETYFCTLRGWDASWCYYSCVRIPIMLDF